MRLIRLMALADSPFQCNAYRFGLLLFFFFVLSPPPPSSSSLSFANEFVICVRLPFYRHLRRMLLSFHVMCHDLVRLYGSDVCPIQRASMYVCVDIFFFFISFRLSLLFFDLSRSTVCRMQTRTHSHMLNEMIRTYCKNVQTLDSNRRQWKRKEARACARSLVSEWHQADIIRQIKHFKPI